MDLIGEDRKWMVGRKLMQINDTLASEDVGLRISKNCTEPGKTGACMLGHGCCFLFWLWSRKGWMLCLLFGFKSKETLRTFSVRV